MELTLVNGLAPTSTTATSGTRRLAEGVAGKGGGRGLRYGGGLEAEAALLREQRKRGLQTNVSDVGVFFPNGRVLSTIFMRVSAKMEMIFTPQINAQFFL